MQLFLAAFESVPDPRAENTRHDLVEILLIAFLAVLCGRSTAPRWPLSGARRSSFSSVS